MNKSLAIARQKEDLCGDLLMLHSVCGKTFRCFCPEWAWGLGLPLTRTAESHDFWHPLGSVAELAVYVNNCSVTPEDLCSKFMRLSGYVSLDEFLPNTTSADPEKLWLFQLAFYCKLASVKQNSFYLKGFCVHVNGLLRGWRGGEWLFFRKWCSWYTLQASLLIFWRSQGYNLQKYLVNQWLEEWELNKSSLAVGNYDLIAYAFWHMDVLLATCLVRQVEGWS